MFATEKDNDPFLHTTKNLPPWTSFSGPAGRHLPDCLAAAAWVPPFIHLRVYYSKNDITCQGALPATKNPP